MTKIKNGISTVGKVFGYIFSQIPGFLVGTGLVLGIVFALWLAPRLDAIKLAADNYQAMKGMKVVSSYDVK